MLANIQQHRRSPQPSVAGLERGEGAGPAEDVGVVLLEAAHAREAGQCAAELVAVQHAKVRVAQRQLPVRPLAVLEHHAVPCSVQQHIMQEQHVGQCAEQHSADGAQRDADC